MYRNVLIRYLCAHDYCQYKILHTSPQLSISYGHLNKSQASWSCSVQKVFHHGLHVCRVSICILYSVNSANSAARSKVSLLLAVGN